MNGNIEKFVYEYRPNNQEIQIFEDETVIFKYNGMPALGTKQAPLEFEIVDASGDFEEWAQKCEEEARNWVKSVIVPNYGKNITPLDIKTTGIKKLEIENKDGNKIEIEFVGEFERIA